MKNSDLRVPPQNIEAEQAILGGILLGGVEALENVMEGGLKWPHFYKQSHGIIFRKMVDLLDRREPIDLLTVTQSFKEGEIESVGGAYYLSGLPESVPSAANIGYYTKIVMDQSAIRRTISVNQEAIEGLYNGDLDVDHANALVLAAADKIDTLGGFKPYSEGVEAAIERLTLIKETGEAPGLQTPWFDMNVLMGLEPGDLIILAARPSMGKTAYATAMARHIAEKLEKPVGIVSIEMSAGQLASREMLKAREIDDSTNIQAGQITGQAYSAAIHEAGILADLPIFVDDDGGQTIQRIRSRARRLKSKEGIGALFIDYLQLITGAQNDQNENTKVAEYTRELKKLARELDIPIILLSQLNRKVDDTGGLKIPQLSHLRDSGAIEQDADIVIFLTRPEMYRIMTDPKTNEDLEGVVIVSIAKSRNGSTGMFRLRFIKQLTKFVNYTSQEEEAPPL